MTPYIIGLTGGIGSGKTTVSNMFAEKGIIIVDADVVARDAVKPNSPALKKIVAHFGDNILLNSGELNRSLLRSKIFSDDAEKQWLNNLLHPLIRADITAALLQCQDDYCILSAPLLFENNLHSMVNRCLVVDVSIETQLMRTCQRDTSNEQEVLAIIASQISRQDRLALADDVINNENVDFENVQTQVDSLNKKYQMLATSYK